MSAEGIRVEVADGILSLVLDRPEKRNALTRAMLQGVARAIEKSLTDAALRAILLRAEGPAFCAGLDLGQVDAEELAEDRMEREREELFGLALDLRNHPLPSVAAVQGANVAGGILLSQACDLVVAAEDAYFYNPLPKMGGVGLEVLFEPWDVGVRRAKRLLFTAERIPAQLAFELGMVTDVAPAGRLLEVALGLAQKLAAMPPVTLRLLKRSLNQAQDLMGMRASLELHFALHQIGHQTRESRRLLHEERQQGSLKEYFERRDQGGQ